MKLLLYEQLYLNKLEKWLTLDQSKKNLRIFRKIIYLLEREITLAI
ncbi:hypothetical protein H6G80_00335 [Nostoc sp. FACHB-87]|nr:MULTISPECIES: hypothetical protein [Nostocales]MBD2301003.1 hypothetical protein [Nostoc sp. FACHB-190]MBD2452550.1 hypothetical protein [Nostoc sp. FACHB-87]MBD2473481.1 hypothetical protein [Anabaena sp. FACHB-83]MBD2486148.1 hypothetical protein [Aulosira sp. FACHB-615]